MMVDESLFCVSLDALSVYSLLMHVFMLSSKPIDKKHTVALFQQDFTNVFF